jgi:hypothetical protein
MRFTNAGMSAPNCSRASRSLKYTVIALSMSGRFQVLIARLRQAPSLAQFGR